MRRPERAGDGRGHISKFGKACSFHFGGFEIELNLSLWVARFLCQFLGWVGADKVRAVLGVIQFCIQTAKKLK